MAPEVFRHEPYNLKVDVYSFAMIVFQVGWGAPAVCPEVFLFAGMHVRSVMTLQGCACVPGVCTCQMLSVHEVALHLANTAHSLEPPTPPCACPQLFECAVPFAGVDPVEAARNAAMLGVRPGFPPRNKLSSIEQVRPGAGHSR